MAGLAAVAVFAGVGEFGAGPVAVGAPSLALAAPEIFTAWWAWLIADWYWPTPPCELPDEDELGLSSTYHRPNAARVATSKPIRGLGRLAISRPCSAAGASY